MEIKQSKLEAIAVFLKTIFLKLSTLVLALVLFVAIPLVNLPIFPLAIWRYCVSKFLIFVNPKLSKVIQSRSHVLAIDDRFNKPKANISVNFTLEGRLEVEKFRQHFETVVLNAKLPNGDKLYPELKQYLTKVAGYYFYTDDESFDLKNHIVLQYPKKLSTTGEVVSSEVNDDDILRTYEEALSKPWERMRPMWKIIITHDYYPKCGRSAVAHSNLMLSVHHSLADGYAMLHLLIEKLFEEKIVNSQPNYSQRPGLGQVLYGLTFPIRYSWELAEILLLCLQSTSAWMRVSDKKNNVFNMAFTDSFPVFKIKETKSHFKVSFSSVVLAALTGAVRELMIKKGITIPTVIPCGVPLPVPRSTSKLRNFLANVLRDNFLKLKILCVRRTMGVCLLPIGEEDDLKRLNLLHKEYERQRKSTIPKFIFWSLKSAGIDPSWLTKRVTQNDIVPMGLTNFPGGLQQLSLNGHSIVDVMCASGLIRGCAGLGFMSLSYLDGFRITVVANEKVLTKEETKELAQIIEKHLTRLRDLVSQDV